MKKWSKKQKLVRNLVILLFILAGIFGGKIALSGLYRNADTAHAASEATLHYGSSDIRAVLEDGNKRHYLGVYEKWFSINTVEKDWKGWKFSNYYGAKEIDYQKPINFSWYIENDAIVIYGIVCDANIASVEIGIRYGEKMVYIKQEDLFDDMFMIKQSRYNQENQDQDTDPVIAEIRGYNQDKVIVYSENTQR